MERLNELGEWELLRRLAAYAPPAQFDDDAALLQERSGRQLVVNTDVLVEHVHFSDATMAASDLGWRAAAANLSDLAAMGCTSVVGITVALVAPGATPWSWVQGVYEGLSAALKHHGGILLGGDCSSGSERLLSVTALGHVEGARTVCRGAGRAGDWLICTGPHGLSRAGLALLLGELHSSATNQLTAEQQARAIEAHRRPRPRLDAIAALAASQPTHSPWRVAGTDSSDGLLAAVAAVASASGCGAQLNRAALPVAAELARLPMAEQWCLNGGEDFELVLALEPAWAQALLATLAGCHCIGTLVGDAHQGVCWTESGQPVSAGPGGYSHFQ